MTDIIDKKVWSCCKGKCYYDRFEYKLRFMEVIPEIAKRLSGIHRES